MRQDQQQGWDGALWGRGLEERHEGQGLWPGSGLATYSLASGAQPGAWNTFPLSSSCCSQTQCVRHVLEKSHNLWGTNVAHRTPQSHIAGPCGLLEKVPARAVPGR